MFFWRFRTNLKKEILALKNAKIILNFKNDKKQILDLIENQNLHKNGIKLKEINRIKVLK